MPRGGRAATVSLVCLLLAGAGGAFFAACALWQAAGIAQALIGLTEKAPRRTAVAPSQTQPPPPAPRPAARAVLPKAATVPSAARSTAGALRAPDPLLAAVPPATDLRASGKFEERAEASEKAIPLGLEGTLSDAEEALTLGEPPPAGFPRGRCDDIFVYIVTIAEGAPLSSAASLGIGKSGRARLRRPGERIGDWTVLAISDDWTGLNPDVWLEKDGLACRAELAGNPARVHVTPRPKPPPPRRRKRRRKR